LIIAILRQAGRPLTVLQLTAEVKRRRFPTASKAPHKLVGKNVYALAAKGVLRRSIDPPGFRIASTGNAKPGKVAGIQAKSPQPTPLKEVLAQILHKSSKPMTGGALAVEVLKAGYQTKSKRLVDNIWTALSNMKDVENIRGEGYRLKKTRT
jgi:hypothetical protein